MSSDTPSDTPKQYYDAEGKPVTLMRLVLTEPAWANNQILDRDRIERELAAARSDLECQGQAYSKALDDLAAANKRLEEARTALDKSEKWLKRLRSCLPSHGSFGESGRDDHESVISSIEKAIAAIDGKEGES